MWSLIISYFAIFPVTFLWWNDEMLVWWGAVKVHGVGTDYYSVPLGYYEPSGELSEGGLFASRPQVATSN